jgi:GNAT superfamily N-acetyltransferase
MTQISSAAKTLSPSNEDAAAAVLTRAFVNDPFYSYVFPDPVQRSHFTCPLWKAVIRTCRLFGKVHTTSGLDGVACWSAPGMAELTFGRALRSGFALPLSILRFPSGPRRLMLRALEVLDNERRRLMPGRFWYLQVLGVEPARQRQGVGSRLIAPILVRADVEMLPCYLETETERNVAFYAKLGFEVLNRLDFPGTPVHLWTMRRDPA